MKNTQILLVDDDPDLIRSLTTFLTLKNFNVVSAMTGSEAVKLFDGENFDLAIFDLNLPDTDGLSLMKEYREKSESGVIILSGQSDWMEKTIGLELGADDYVGKPFEPRELFARIKSVLRRTDKKVAELSELKTEGKNSGNIFKFNGWVLVKTTRTLFSPNGEEVDLTSHEFDLLNIFLENPNIVLSREKILEKSENEIDPAFDRSIDNRVHRMRSKLGSSSKMIKTIRNAGYIFLAEIKIE
jgi:two-component system OmpR family response regulator